MIGSFHQVFVGSARGFTVSADTTPESMQSAVCNACLALVLLLTVWAYRTRVLISFLRSPQRASSNFIGDLSSKVGLTDYLPFINDTSFLPSPCQSHLLFFISVSLRSSCFLSSCLMPFVALSDDEQHNQTFEAAGAGASLTFPMQCSALRKNGYVVIKGRPCKIAEMSTSKTGKHGHAKVHIVGIDIFTSRKYEDISPSTHNMDVPNVSRTEYLLVNIEDGFLNLLTQDGASKDDVKVPEGELGDELTAQFESGKDLCCTITAAMGEEMCLAFKEAPKN
ncbi:hypothetical protein O181_033637 [Austropuccinia psidii MF-1]|uniref:Translation initiation factor 5A C-terminal domain-containing protein n=1 Tax=Austropuccinia psidii MF-1 TaxID=1389203 RepID=A0A9Q3D507_9BASI|nr:hypothetical protein [Austropuccinia psidii MF-1]